jgi:iron(III) transport system substrate-binding protein
MKEFQAASGIAYSFVPYDAAEPMARADIYFGESYVDLWELAEADLFRPWAVSLVERIAAPGLADPERRFVPLSAKLRTIYFNETLVSPEEISTIVNFAALADERWKRKLCLSSSALNGNRLLVAHLIARHDVREAEIIVRGWLRNLATAEFETDETLLAAISAGHCSAGIVDSGLVSRLGRPDNVRLHLFPAGPWLYDIGGAAVSRHAGSPEAAASLLEWLLSAAGNSAYAGDWQQAPLSRELLEESEDVPDWKPIFEGAASLSGLGFLLEEADLLVERAGYR